MGAAATRSAGIDALLGDAAALLGDRSPSATSRLILCMRNSLFFFLREKKKESCLLFWSSWRDPTRCARCLLLGARGGGLPCRAQASSVAICTLLKNLGWVHETSLKTSVKP